MLHSEGSDLLDPPDLVGSIPTHGSVVGLCGKVLVAGGRGGGFCEKDLEAAPCLVRAPLVTRVEPISDVVLRLCESIFKTRKKTLCHTQQLGERERREEQPCRGQGQ